MDNSTTKAKLSDFKSLVAFILCQHLFQETLLSTVLLF